MAKKIQANGFSVSEVLRKLEKDAELPAGDLELNSKKENISLGTLQNAIRQEIFSRGFGKPIGTVEMAENPVALSDLFLLACKRVQLLGIYHPIFTEKILAQGRIFV